MTERDYMGETTRLLLAMQLIAEVDLDFILETTARADALGPFLDPTAYRDQLYRGDMHAVEALAQAVKPAVDVWRERIAPKLPDGAGVPT